MDIDSRFKRTLLSQAQAGTPDHMERLRRWCGMAQQLACLQGGIAVVSDILHNKSHIYSGLFGQNLGLAPEMEIDSAFEDIVFSFIDPQDLLDRHILELRYIELVKTLPASERTDYMQSSRIGIHSNGTIVPIIHQTRYLEVTDSGSINIGLCTYLPVGEYLPDAFEGQILNIRTGLPLSSDQIKTVDDNLLTHREREVLSLLSEGLSSKQVASRLHLSLNTVYRHRQNIIRNLNVANTAEAVRIGLKMKLV